MLELKKVVDPFAAETGLAPLDPRGKTAPVDRSESIDNHCGITPGHRNVMSQEKLSLTELVKRHPLLTTVFGFWGFGYTFMVPNLLGGRFLQAFFHAVGSEPGKVFLGFGALFFMVFLFAGVVPFALWYFVCQALESADTSSQTPKNG